jgi:formylmethanofuran dehydrogenase subunit E
MPKQIVPVRDHDRHRPRSATQLIHINRYQRRQDKIERFRQQNRAAIGQQEMAADWFADLKKDIEENPTDHDIIRIKNALAEDFKPEIRFCDVCGIGFETSEMIQDANGDWICNPCSHLEYLANTAITEKDIGIEPLTECEWCGGNFTSTDMVDFNGKSLCKPCAESRKCFGDRCPRCGTPLSFCDNDATEREEAYCEHCGWTDREGHYAQDPDQARPESSPPEPTPYVLKQTMGAKLLDRMNRCTQEANVSLPTFFKNKQASMSAMTLNEMEWLVRMYDNFVRLRKKDLFAQQEELRELVKAEAPTLSVRADRGTARGYLMIAPKTKNRWRPWTRHEINTIESLGLGNPSENTQEVSVGPDDIDEKLEIADINFRAMQRRRGAVDLDEWPKNLSRRFMNELEEQRIEDLRKIIKTRSDNWMD